MMYSDNGISQKAIHFDEMQNIERITKYDDFYAGNYSFNKGDAIGNYKNGELVSVKRTGSDRDYSKYYNKGLIVGMEENTKGLSQNTTILLFDTYSEDGKGENGVKLCYRDGRLREANPIREHEDIPDSVRSTLQAINESSKDMGGYLTPPSWDIKTRQPFVGG